MKKKIFFLLIALLCIIVFIACTTDDYVFKSPIEEYDVTIHNNIIGKWKLVGKNFTTNSSLDTYVDLTEENKYIEFIKIGNEKYGKYVSNIYPVEGYYIPVIFGICFYHSFNSLQDKSSKVGGWDYAAFDDINMRVSDFKKLRLTYYLDLGWFEDHSIYQVYYFKKMEDE